MKKLPDRVHLLCVHCRASCPVPANMMQVVNTSSALGDTLSRWNCTYDPHRRIITSVLYVTHLHSEVPEDVIEGRLMHADQRNSKATSLHR